MSALSDMVEGIFGGVPAEHAIGPLSQIPRGEGRNFEIGGRVVAVFRTHQDEVFASQATCPHKQGPLADGMLGGATLMCPLHDRTYDLRTGKVLVGECDIAVYPVRRDEDGTLVVTV
jgi:nitrite reductase (NADH) small subunit